MNMIFASSNSGKIIELQALLNPLDITIVPQTELNIADVPETGTTFIENALIKARHASRESGMPAIADDSGLVVKALNGAPGIFSARYAGSKANAKDNIQKLLSELRDTPEQHRSAYFYCALVYLAHADDPTPLVCEGIWHGKILMTPSGQDGFGYDPVFYDPILHCSAAELSLDKKNRVSHRGQALKMLLDKFQARGIQVCTHSP